MHKAKVEYSLEVASKIQSEADQGIYFSTWKAEICLLPSQTRHLFVQINAKVQYFVITYY